MSDTPLLQRVAEVENKIPRPSLQGSIRQRNELLREDLPYLLRAVRDLALCHISEDEWSEHRSECDTCRDTDAYYEDPDPRRVCSVGKVLMQAVLRNNEQVDLLIRTGELAKEAPPC